MLTDAHCRNATCPPDKKRARLADAGGLYLEVSPSGSKRWFWKYRLAGLEKRLALGSYPDVGLTAARKARDLAKKGKADGRDPAQVRKVEKIKAATPAPASLLHNAALPSVPASRCAKAPLGAGHRFAPFG